jgi:hypothetical protein
MVMFYISYITDIFMNEIEANIIIIKANIIIIKANIIIIKAL